jgi:threonine/homoserine/homoserine lactone efflux protein
LLLRLDLAYPYCGRRVVRWEQSAILTAVYVVVAALIHAAVVLSADSVKPLLASPKLRGGLGTVFALLLVAIAIWLAVSTRWR